MTPFKGMCETPKSQLLRQFAETNGLPFSGVLTEESLQYYFEKHNVSHLSNLCTMWSPLVVLWAFLSQCISPDKSCSAAVLRVIGLLFAGDLPPCSANTGAYCKARMKLPQSLLRNIAYDLGWKMERKAPKKWLWSGRNVFLVDGTTMTMPDTEANQKKYPQQRGQKEGLGFPIIRLVVIFSLATGAVVGIAWAPYRGKQTGESSLLRRLMDLFRPGDVLIGDSIYASHWMFVLARKKKLDLLLFQHHARKTDFRVGKKLGHKDHLTEWEKTPRSSWMTKRDYKALSKQLKTNPLKVRELSADVTIPGFRTKKLVLATTFLSATQFPKEDLACLYRERWNAELDLRNLKTTLQMDHLRCKSPEMVEKEILAHFLAYNPIRILMCQSAMKMNCLPRDLSFNGARQVLVENRAYLTTFTDEKYEENCDLLLFIVSQKKVGNRPDRVEPRAKKRRPNTYKNLKKPRKEARMALLSA